LNSDFFIFSSIKSRDWLGWPEYEEHRPRTEAAPARRGCARVQQPLYATATPPPTQRKRGLAV